MDHGDVAEGQPFVRVRIQILVYIKSKPRGTKNQAAGDGGASSKLSRLLASRLRPYRLRTPYCVLVHALK